MPLAVLLDAVGEAAKAPIFLLFDIAAIALDDGLEMGGEGVDRLRADVLARDQEMLVESHIHSLVWAAVRRGRVKPLIRIGSPGRRTIRQGPESADWGLPATAAA